MLSIYVGYFKLVGSKVHLLADWQLLRQGLHIEPEQRIDDKGAVYLGCRHVVFSMKLPNGGMATATTYDIEDFLKLCITRYLEVVGTDANLRNYSIPFLLRTIGVSCRCSRGRTSLRMPMVLPHRATCIMCPIPI